MKKPPTRKRTREGKITPPVYPKQLKKSHMKCRFFFVSTSCRRIPTSTSKWKHIFRSGIKTLHFLTSENEGTSNFVILGPLSLHVEGWGWLSLTVGSNIPSTNLSQSFPKVRLFQDHFMSYGRNCDCCFWF